MGRCRPDKTDWSPTSKQHELCSVAGDTSNSEPLFQPSMSQMFKEGMVRNEICTLTYVVSINLGQFREANPFPNSVSWNLGSKTPPFGGHLKYSVKYSKITDYG